MVEFYFDIFSTRNMMSFKFDEKVEPINKADLLKNLLVGSNTNIIGQKATSFSTIIFYC